MAAPCWTRRRPGRRRPRRRRPARARTRCCWSIPPAPPAGPRARCWTSSALALNALNAPRTSSALTAADRVLTVLPLFHVGGLNIQTRPRCSPAPRCCCTPRFEPGRLLRRRAPRDRPTLSLLVPAVMQALVAHPALGRGRPVLACAPSAPAPPTCRCQLIEAFHASGVPVQQVYGATETCPIAIVQTRAEALAAPGSIGRPALHVEARLAAPATERDRGARPDRRCAATGSTGGDGRGARATAGSPPAMSAACDAEGRCWFTDRLKHVIISRRREHLPGRGRARAAAPRPASRKARSAAGRTRAGARCRWPWWCPARASTRRRCCGISRAGSRASSTRARWSRWRALPRTALGKVHFAALSGLVRLPE